jgi:DHA2 family multidrug resistance protein
MEGITRRLGTTLDSPLARHQAALREIWVLAYGQAETLSYADAFRAVMVAFVVATCLVPLMRKVVPPKGPAAAAGH